MNFRPSKIRRRGLAVRWLVFGLAAVAAVGLVFADWYRTAPPTALAEATYVGRQSCIDCHQPEHEDWTGSHHDLAMDTATDASVLGDFNDTTFERLGVTTRFFRNGERFMVNTEGPDGKNADFEIKYTFGVDPLQQYMVEFPDGRVQVLRVSWDTHAKRWFYVPPPDVTDERLKPDDPLHWTGIAQNWNTTCAICHSTNLQKKYDLASDTYRTTYSEIDVSCEECHGPASLHVELATAKSLFWDRTHGYGLAKLKSADSTAQIESCAKCHSRRSAVHGDFRPGTPLLDSYEPALLQTGLYHADGQILDEVYVYGSFLQSKMHTKGVRCTDCHNPHSLKLKFDGNALCAQCHQPAKYDVVGHHHHPVGPTNLDGVGTQCVDCHMPATSYMVLDARRDHSLRIPRPDLTVSVGTPNACNGCHTKAEENAEWAAAKVVEWFGKDRRDDPHWAPAFAAGRVNDPNAVKPLIATARRNTSPAIVKATAIELLGQFDDAAGRKAIERALTDSDPLIRLAATRAAQAESAEGLVSQLGEQLIDPIRAVRTEAARRLAGVPFQTLSRSQQEAFDRALVEYRQRQGLQSEHAAEHINLANLAMQMQNGREAVAELQTAIRLEPYLSGPRGQLAQILESAGSDKQTVQKLRAEEIELLERDAGYAPDNATVRYRLGLLQYQTGELDDAEKSLAAASRLAPQSFDFLMTLALLQEQQFAKSGKQEDYERASDSLRRLKTLAPGDPRPGNIRKRLEAK